MQSVVVFASVLLHLVLMATASEKVVAVLTFANIDEDPRILNSTYKITTYKDPPYFSLDLTIDILRRLSNLQFQAEYIVKTGKANNVFYNRTINFCAFLKRPSERLIKLVFDSMKRVAKPYMPSACPIEPMTVKFLNMTLPQTALPAFLPQTNFHVHVNFWQDSEPILSSQWHGRLRRIRV